MEPLLDRARDLAPDLIALRRELHRRPELDRHLPLTQALVLDAIKDLDLEVTTGSGLSSVTAVLRGGGHDGAGPVVLLRGDMDALPVAEETGLPFASEHEGQMHACGHDLHVAGLVGAARLLHERRADLAGDVVLMWQPAEETTAGAMAMIDEGLLEAAGRPTDAAYCLHVMSSGRPLGTWFSRPGPLMAASDEFVVRVVGVGGHASAPHLARDPIPVACEMVTALQTLVTRRIDIDDPVVLTVGKFAAGTKENIIPDEAVFEATIRSFSPANRVLLEDAVHQLLHGIADAHGLKAEIEWTAGYPPTVNDVEEYAFARTTLEDLFGPERYDEEPFSDPGTEDFSYVLERVPGAYVSISACPADADPVTAPDNHSSRAVFDDSVLPDCAAFLAEVATRRIARGALRPVDVVRTPDERFADLPDFPFDPHYLTLGDGVRMHHVDEGPPDGAPVLMLHGEPSWSYLYRWMIPVFAGAGFRAVAPDLVGFGRSDKPTSVKDYSYQRHMDWLTEWLEAVDLRDVTLVCQDWGSLLGLRLAAEQGDRFSRIVVANGFLPTAERDAGLPFRLWRAFATWTPVFPVGRIVATGTKRRLSPAEVAAYDAPFHSRRSKAGARAFPGLVPTSSDDPAVPANREAWRRLGEWEKPFLTLFGASDPILGRADRPLQAHVPGAQGEPHARVDGSHFVQEDAGQEIARRTIEWIGAAQA